MGPAPRRAVPDPGRSRGGVRSPQPADRLEAGHRSHSERGRAARRARGQGALGRLDEHRWADGSRPTGSRGLRVGNRGEPRGVRRPAAVHLVARARTHGLARSPRRGCREGRPSLRGSPPDTGRSAARRNGSAPYFNRLERAVRSQAVVRGQRAGPDRPLPRSGHLRCQSLPAAVSRLRSLRLAEPALRGTVAEARRTTAAVRAALLPRARRRRIAGSLGRSEARAADRGMVAGSLGSASTFGSGSPSFTSAWRNHRTPRARWRCVDAVRNRGMVVVSSTARPCRHTRARVSTVTVSTSRS